MPKAPRARAVSVRRITVDIHWLLLHARPLHTQIEFMQCNNGIFCAFQAGTLPVRHVTVSVSKTSA